MHGRKRWGKWPWRSLAAPQKAKKMRQGAWYPVLQTTTYLHKGNLCTTSGRPNQHMWWDHAASSCAHSQHLEANCGQCLLPEEKQSSAPAHLAQWQKTPALEQAHGRLSRSRYHWSTAQEPPVRSTHISKCTQEDPGQQGARDPELT